MEINAQDLDKKTLEQLGIKMESSLSQRGTRHMALGKVLKALGPLEEADALWVLTEARHALERQGQAVDNVLTNDNSYIPSIGYTLQVVARHFKLSVADLQRRSRMPEIAEARQVAMYLLGMTNAYTLAVIGAALGGRTPATVSHGFQKVAKLLSNDKRLARSVETIGEELK